MRTVEKFLVLDTETANSLENPLVYDIGYIVADRQGNIYEKSSLAIYDIFVLEKSLMKSSYYANKLFRYEVDIFLGNRTLKNLLTVKKEIADLFKKYNIKKVFAYNMYFDKTALNTTIRYITKSSLRWFFPYGTEFHDIWNFACSTLCQQKGYADFCEENGYISNRGRNYKATAETVYQYITKNTDFVEEHQGIDDVLIEYAILLKCYSLHKKVTTDIDRLCWRKVKRV